MVEYCDVRWSPISHTIITYLAWPDMMLFHLGVMVVSGMFLVMIDAECILSPFMILIKAWIIQ